jgi:ribose-phosphate pyrophosphokinase
MSAVLLHFEEDLAGAKRIAQAADMSSALIERHRFPDGEVKLRLPASLPERSVILRSLNQPNEKLIEVLLAASTARTLGARHLTLVSPYLAYMRQDIAFAPGETVSQRIIGDFLANLFDKLITVDPHLHRAATLRQAVPAAQAIAISGASPLSDLIAQRRPSALLIGPDEESAQWIAQAAERHHFQHAVCRKVRLGDNSVKIDLNGLDPRGKAAVLLDDIASTGYTLAKTAEVLLAAGATSVDIAVTHALFVNDALQVIKRAGVGEIWSTDCIEHPTNAVSVAPLIAEALNL